MEKCLRGCIKGHKPSAGKTTKVERVGLALLPDQTHAQKEAAKDRKTILPPRELPYYRGKKPEGFGTWKIPSVGGNVSKEGI